MDDTRPVDQAGAEQVLLPEGRSVARARALVTELCRAAEVDDDARETAVLLTSETVTNAIIHGRSEVRVRVDVTGTAVRIGVGDDNSRHPSPQPEDSDALDGRGLQILELAASRWGVTEELLGKVVWFEVDRHRPEGPEGASAA